MTNIYRADFPNAPAYFSNVDLKAAFYRKYSGLASGSLSDHMHAFFMRETGLGPGLGMGTYLKSFLAQTSAKSFKEWESGKYVESVRTNFATTPRRVQAVLFGGGVGSSAEVADARWKGGNPLRAQWTAEGAGNPYAALKTGVQFSLGTWAVSARYSLSGSNATITSDGIAIGGGAPPANTGGAFSSVPSGDGTFVGSRIFNVTGLGTGTGMGDPILKLAPNAGADTVFTVGDVVMEVASSVGEYFDGDRPNSFHKRHAWTGAANASPSTQTTKTWVK